MKHQSLITPRGAVPFPVFLSERIYMREFYKHTGLPDDLARWQPTIDAMLEGVDTSGPIYLMIDQGVVRSGQTHRRPGIHIDGYWAAEISAHRGAPPGHRPSPSPIPPSHRATPQRHQGNAEGWSNSTFDFPEDIILASNIAACEAYVGEFNAPIGEMGDCRHISLDTLDRVALEAGRAYAGNVTCLHASLPVAIDTERTLVRLNIPGWTAH